MLWNMLQYKHLQTIRKSMFADWVDYQSTIVNHTINVTHLGITQFTKAKKEWNDLQKMLFISYQVSGVGCQVSGVRCQTPIAKLQNFHITLFLNSIIIAF